MSDPFINSDDSPESELSAESSWLPSRPDEPFVSFHNESSDPLELSTGDVYGDFLVRSELGRGAFGAVYLAQQFSLQRSVALKVTAISSVDACVEEGLTLAKLNHPSIVQVFSQTIDTKRKRRTLCMQYVPGLTLRKLARLARDEFGDSWCGRDVLQILDRSANQQGVVLDSISLKDRAALESCDHTQAICWLGTQMALALEHAHAAGIVHRDIKPENTIVNQFGRPLLVDFNLAMPTAADQSRNSVGGTLPYMAPEALLAWVDSQQPSGSSQIIESTSHQMDVYALGVLLWELAVGRRPFDVPPLDQAIGREERLAIYEKPPASVEKLSGLLRPILLRALHPDREQRYSSAKAFADNLVGVSQQTHVLQLQENTNPIIRSIIRRPVLWLFAVAVLPHVFSSVLQILYNLAEIISHLSPGSRMTFNQLVVFYNIAIYGGCVAAGSWVLMSAVGSAKEQERPATQDLDRTRQAILRLPSRIAWIGGIGWVLGGISFPTTIQFAGDPLSPAQWWHFLFSFLFAGGMAVTYSYALMSAVVVIGFYASLHFDVGKFRQHASTELNPFRSRWHKLTLLAGVMPLGSAIVLLFTHDFVISDAAENTWFKILMTLLILAGVIGSILIGVASQPTRRVIDRCLGANDD